MKVFREVINVTTNKKMLQMKKNGQIFIKKNTQEDVEILFKFKHYFVCFKGNKKDGRFYKINKQGEASKCNELLCYYLSNYIFEELLPEENLKEDCQIHKNFISEISSAISGENMIDKKLVIAESKGKNIYE